MSQLGNGKREDQEELTLFFQSANCCRKESFTSEIVEGVISPVVVEISTSPVTVTSGRLPPVWTTSDDEV